MEKFYSEWRQLQSDMHESMLSQVADVASSTEGAFKDFFNNLVEGKETFGDAFSDLVDTIMESVVQQITDKWAAQITSSILAGFWAIRTAPVVIWEAIWSPAGWGPCSMPVLEVCLVAAMITAPAESVIIPDSCHPSCNGPKALMMPIRQQAC